MVYKLALAAVVALFATTITIAEGEKNASSTAPADKVESKKEGEASKDENKTEEKTETEKKN